MVAKAERHEWRVAEAKNKFSELLDRAENEGPQRINRHGKIYTVTREIPAPGGDGDALVQFLLNGPRWDGVKIERQRDFGRDIDL